METIRSLENLTIAELYTAFGKAFKDYDVQISRSELEVMISRRGFVPELSFGVFVDNRLVSFTLNGIGLFNGVKTAYDTGTGTIEAFRGKGLASRIFQYSVPQLKKARVQQYLLEVLQHNASAVSVYRKQGFQVSREFNYFVEEANMVQLDRHVLLSDFLIRPIHLGLREQMTACWDFSPSWQNSFESIERRLNDFQLYGAFFKEKLVGYCVFEPGSGDITQIAVHRDFRSRGLATCLLREAIKANQHQNLKLINTDTTFENITLWAESIGLTQRGKQFEMMKEL